MEDNFSKIYYHFVDNYLGYIVVGDNIVVCFENLVYDFVRVFENNFDNDHHKM